MIKNIKKGDLPNLKMLMASAYSASRFSNSSHCCNCISPTILAILAKVQLQAGKYGKDMQYIRAKFSSLDDAAITTIHDTQQHWDLGGAWRSAWSKRWMLQSIYAVTHFVCLADCMARSLCFDWWSSLLMILAILANFKPILTSKDGKNGLQQPLNLTVANHVRTCIETGT